MRALFLSVFMTALATTGFAQTPDAVPERRIVVTENVDFYGSDLRNIFETSFDTCEAACLADPTCRAFTYNLRSSSCFPKSAVTEVQPYDGALSARVYDTDPFVLSVEAQRIADLDFLRPVDFGSTLDLSKDIGDLHPANDVPVAQLLLAAQTNRNRGNTLAALRFTGAAIALTDAADQWSEYARLARNIDLENSREERRVKERAVPAAIAGYMRARTDPQRVATLLELAYSLESAGRGRDMIPALRLAYQISPRADVDGALEDAIGKYGFRVTNTQVESDSASPRICASFSERLHQAGVDYRPFVQLPDDTLSVEVSGDQLCIDGVEHGVRYRFALREGLPSESGETMHRTTDLTLYVRDRAASVTFPGREYVLPRTADAALPIQSVNASNVELSLLRVSDRNIIRSMQENLFGQPLSVWSLDRLEQDIAEEIWTGTAELGNDLNQDMTTRLPLAEAIEGRPAGIYVLKASLPAADRYEDPPAMQWFVLSDIGLTTMMGEDGLTVLARSLETAGPLDGYDVRLVSRANAVLGTAQTDAQGIARFDPGLVRGQGGAAPALVTVHDGADDLGLLSLTDPAFDLSDRGVEGRAPSPAMDVFLTPDRGAYRAGETIHATALVRDNRAAAVTGVPMTAILYRPDGVEYARMVSTAGASGGHVFALPVADTAPRGTYRIAIHADVNAPALASDTVLVEDFVPERIDFTLDMAETVRLGDTPPLRIQADYLFGAPGGDLPIEGELRLSAASGLAEWPGYSFGRYDQPFRARAESLPAARTDAAGAASVPLRLPEVEEAGRPMTLGVTVRIAEGSGRPVERRTEATVLPDGPILGIRPMFEDVAAEGSAARFQLIGLGPELEPDETEVTWIVNRVRTRYQWYQLYCNWDWERIETRERVASGTATLGAVPTEISADVDWGRYEIVVERADGVYASASQEFYAGWYAPADAGATPDFLEASLDAESYRIGDTARFRIVPRYAGTAVVSVMTNRVISMETVEVSEGETVIELPVTEEWGAGAYVTASVLRPMEAETGRNPARSLGLSYAPVDPADKALSVALDLPETAQPRSQLNVGIDVAGLSEGDTAYVTLAAVDVGILNLTGFDSPDPESHYFGQRRLGVEMRDIYGRLLDGTNGALGTVRSGGDAMSGMRMQSPPPTEELLAYFQGPVQLGPDGRAEVTFDLPSFNGTVRVMAVAWSETGVGSAEDEVLVRDPIVVAANMPRFLAPGDRSRLALDLTHTEGPAGEVTVDVVADGVTLSGPSMPMTLTLGEGESQTVTLPLEAGAVGTHALEVSLTTPDGQILTKDLTLGVVLNDPEISRTSRFSLAAGETFTFDDQVFSGFRAGSASSTLSVGPVARFDAPGLLNALDRYPYGCTEQITSRALPLLYFNDVASAMNLASDQALQTRIDQSITEVLGNQAANGSFGLWRPSSGDLWLDAYVTDFLSRARSRGFDVPEIAWRNATDNLRNRVNYYPDFDAGGADLAYALMVLAREGAASVGDLRYYSDEKADAFSSPLAAAQLGAALAYYGDQTRADGMFARAGNMISRRAAMEELPVWRSDYGTDRRDAAAVLALAVEAGSRAVDRDALSARVTRPDPRISTQEAVWTLLAANALIDDTAATGVTVDGLPPKGPIVHLRDADTSLAPVRIANAGDEPTDITLTTYGVPETPEPAGGNGYAMGRAYYSMEGSPIDPNGVSVGTRMVVVVTVRPFGERAARLMVDDPLPAGFEIDNPNLIRGGDIRGLDWLETANAEMTEFRTDRFLAAVDWRSEEAIQLAYIVRAVSPGSFHHPAASVEDMYRPAYRAHTDTGRIAIVE